MDNYRRITSRLGLVTEDGEPAANRGKVIVAALLGGLALITLLLVIFARPGSSAIAGAVQEAEQPGAQANKDSERLLSRARVVPAQSAELKFPRQGVFAENPVAEILVKEGDTVKKGDPLARVDTRDAQLRVDHAQALLDEMRATHERLRAEGEAERLRAEAEIGFLPAEAAAARRRTQAEMLKLQADALKASLEGQADVSSSLYSSAEALGLAATLLAPDIETHQQKLAGTLDAINVAYTATLTSALSRIEQAEIALKREQLALEQSVLRSPIDGTVVEINLAIGEVPAGNSADIVVGDLSAWRVETDGVSDINVVQIEQNEPVIITFDALPGVEIPGIVSHIKPLGKPNPSDPNALYDYTITVTPSRHEQALRWNMRAWVAFSAR